MKLRKIHIGNYRKLKNCIIEFDEKQTVFVGANNSGKTSAMQAIISFLKDNNRFTANDFTLTNWKKLNEIAEGWINEDADSPKPILADISDFLPTMDVWIDVSEEDAYLVKDLIPSFEWKGQTVGMRILYAPKDIEKLHDEFRDVYMRVRTLEKDGAKTVSPTSFWDYLSSNTRLHNSFSCHYYVLDIEKEKTNGDFQALPDIEYDGESKNPFEKLFKIHSIEAQREFSDPDGRDNLGQNNLSRQLQAYYEQHIQQREVVSQEDVDIFKAAENANKVCDEKLEMAFSGRIDELKNISYPGFLNPEIKIHSKINVKDTLSHDSAVQFLLNKGEEELVLPEKYNGLGYQNLISMYFKLIQFRDEWLHEGTIGEETGEVEAVEPIHLVLIEEPEAHLHAQAQQVFVRKAYETLTHSDKIKDQNSFTTQVVLSTHSNHIVKELDMNCLRYFRRELSKEIHIPISTVVSLLNIFGKDKDTKKFVTRYIQLNHCDFFFADAVILVEGAGERILMPRFLEKEGVIDNYISVVEINGSHAHRFRSLVEVLNIPTLVITDIDSQDVNAKGEKRKAYTQKGKGQVSDNDTLKKWLPEESDVDNLLKIPSKDKISGNVRIAYQTGIKLKLHGSKRTSTAFPYTFEDALALTNIELFTADGLKGVGMVRKFRDILKASTTASKCSKELFKSLNSTQKAPFAIDLLFMDEFEQLNTPEYIKEGLIWLDEKLNPEKYKDGKRR